MKDLIHKVSALHKRIKIGHTDKDSFSVYVANDNREKVVKVDGGYQIEHWNRHRTRTLDSNAVVGFFQMRIRKNNL